MSSGPNSAGPRGLALLGLAAVAGILLGVHGWSTRHNLAAIGSVGSAAGTGPAVSATGRPSANATAGPQAARPSASAPGPLLSSQSYAQYAFLVWPGSLSASARTAEIGLAITVHRSGTGLEVSAGVNGQAAGAPHFYPAGARVYVIEASLGDDSGNSDYSLGDDGLVVTDAQGRILQ